MLQLIIYCGPKPATIERADILINAQQPCSNLYALVAGTGCHSAAVEVVGDIVDEVLVVCRDVPGYKHLAEPELRVFHCASIRIQALD